MALFFFRQKNISLNRVTINYILKGAKMAKEEIEKLENEVAKKEKERLREINVKCEEVLNFISKKDLDNAEKALEKLGSLKKEKANIDARIQMENRLEKDLEKLNEMTFEDERRDKIVKEITDIGKTLNEIVKTEGEQYNKEQDLELKKKQQKIDKIKNVGQTVIGGVSTVMYAVCLIGEIRGIIPPRITNLLPKPFTLLK